MYKTIISVSDAFQYLKNPDWLFFDARFNLADKSKGKSDFAAGHIPGAQYVHLDDDLSGEIIPGVTGRHPLPLEDDFVECLKSWGVSGDKQIVVYDDSHGGVASRLWWMLQCLGHRSVAVLDGGWNKWRELEMPISTLEKTTTKGTFEKCTSEFSCVNAEVVLKSQSDPHCRIIDARGELRYLGIEENIDPIAGHIKSAINKPFLNNLTEHGVWRSKNEIEADWRSSLSDRDTIEETIMYCGSGVTACHNILACTYAGLKPPMLYSGSWSDWITDPSRL